MGNTVEKKIILSIIVPAYNAENSLDCFFDHLFQSKYLDRIEVIIVNDGSTDQTYKVAEQYRTYYPDFIRVINQENSGHGGALTAGIQQAIGECCRPVDADDWLDPASLDKVVEYLVSHNANDNIDMIITDHSKFDIHNNTLKKISWSYLSSDPNILQTLNQEGKLIGYHSGFFRTAILKDVPAYDKKCFYVDNEYIAYSMPKVQKIQYLPWPLYVHTIGDERQSTSPVSLRKNVKHLHTVLFSILKFNESNTGSTSQKIYIRNIASTLLGLYCSIAMSFPGNEGKKMLIKTFEDLKNQFPAFYNDKNQSKLFSLLRTTRCRFYAVTRSVWMIKNKKGSGLIW